VLAAFVLYRLQSDSASLRQDAQTLIGAVDNTQPTQSADPPATLSKLLGSERYKELLTELEYIYQRDQARFPPSGSGQEHAYLRLKANIESRDKILAALRTAFWLTAPVILGSVLVLCCAHTLSQYTPVTGFVLFLGAASLLVCLWLYWRLITAALFDDGREKAAKKGGRSGHLQLSSVGKHNFTGLFLELVGVVVLFFFGMPFHVPTGGMQALALEQLDQNAIDLERRYTIYGGIGFACLLLGTALQMWAAVKSERKG